ncbi:hypothetical protein Tco_1546662 [Tanacetum coccineum]
MGGIYGNPPNTTINSFLKPYLKAQEISDIEKEGERSQKKCKDNNSNLEINTLNKVPKSDNKNDEQPNKRVCKVKKFKAISYLLGPNEEFIAIKSCEYNAWEKNEDRPRWKEIDNVGEVSIICEFVVVVDFVTWGFEINGFVVVDIIKNDGIFVVIDFVILLLVMVEGRLFLIVMCSF